MKNNAITLPQPGAPAARPTVLIVDDSRLMRVAIKKILKDEFELIEAVDGEDAWAKLEAEPAVQCIFSDLSMPNLDGYGLLARVRGSADAHIKSLPFIVITGKEGDLGGLLEEVRGHGATDLVGKPFKSDEIIARTRSLLADVAPVPQPVETVAELVQEAVPSESDLAAQRQAEEALRIATEAEARRLAESQDAARVAAEQARLKAAAEETRRLAAEAEARRLREAQETARREAEEARRQAAEEEARRLAAEAEARRLREAQEAARQAAETARLAAMQTEQERMAAEEAARRQAEEEARVCEELRAAARRHAEEKERLRREEEEALRIRGLKALFVRLALPFMSLGNRLLRLGKGETLNELRRRLR